MNNEKVATNIWIKTASTVVVVVVGGLAAVVLERLGVITHELGSLQSQILQVEEIDRLSERVTRLEEHSKLFELESKNAAFAQLSSAKTQRIGPNKRMLIEMELRDAISQVKFDPRRSKTDIEIQVPGAYFIIAAPQTNTLISGETQGVCFDLWMEVNKKDIANSNVRHCFPAKDLHVTDVIVSQGVGCFEKGDVLRMWMGSEHNNKKVGIVAIEPENEPLVPSIILSMLRVGGC